MILEKYNYIYSLPPFKLHNSGVLCYLNTCIQSLLSLPIFNKMINDQAYLNNILVKEFNKLYNDIQIYKDGKVYDLCLYFKSLNNTKIIDGRQNDSFEIFKFILELLPEDFYKIFYCTYNLFIKCNVCKCITNSNIQSDLTINLSLLEYNNKKLNNNEIVNEYIKTHINTLEDYICDKCKIKNTSIQICNIKNIPNCLILSFHDNHSNLFFNKKRISRFYPSELKFTTKLKSNIIYKPVSVIKHYGSLFSGHYNGQFLRSNSYLKDKLKLFIKKIEHTKNTKNTKNTTTTKTEIQYNNYINTLKNKSDLGIYNINDSYFNELNNFTQDIHTYYVIYCIFDIN